MMKKLEQIKKLSETTRLASAKKDALRNNLIQFMHANPIPEVQPAGLAWEFLFNKKFMLPASAFAAIILVGSGTSLAAENALPGDPLYAVKIKFTEPLIAALQVAPAAEATWHTRIAERRLEEADTLAIKGKLTAEAKSEIEAKFEASAVKAAQTIAFLDAKGDGEAEEADHLSAKFESSLKAHAEILARFTPGAEKEDSGATAVTFRVAEKAEANADPLVLKIRSTIDSIAKARGEAEVKISNDNSLVAAAAEGKVRAAANVIASVQTFLNKNSARLSPEALLAAKTRLAKAVELEAAAEAKLAVQDYKAAFSMANLAARKAQETRVLAVAQFQIETEHSANAGFSATATAAPALNLLTVNPQAESEDDAIINSVTAKPVTSTNPTLNVDGTVKTLNP